MSSNGKFLFCPSSSQVFVVGSHGTAYRPQRRYKKFSLQFYTILMSFADDLQAVSVDEALIDVSQRVAQARAYAVQEGADDDERDFAKELAQEIRDEVRKATSCEG